MKFIVWVNVLEDENLGENEYNVKSPSEHVQGKSGATAVDVLLLHTLEVENIKEEFGEEQNNVDYLSLGHEVEELICLLIHVKFLPLGDQ